jgi:alpha-L-arabinofuranosidase
MGCERNADTVSMVSYAPLLGHVEGRTELTGAPPPWHAMIYFDGTRAFGTVSYYLWKLFGENVPDQMVKTDVAIPAHHDFRVAGQIGIGTWNTSAEFKDIRVEKNGATLLVSDFSQNAEGWETEGRRGGGRWAVQEGAFRQSQQTRASRFNGNEEWSDYTLTLKARKLSGGEGFLIMFGRKGGEMFWWNLGGWGNTQHAVEHSVQGNQTPVGAAVPGTIETDRWYDIRIELAGRNIRCHLDGKLIHEVRAEPAMTLYAAGGMDGNELVLKVINLASSPVTSQLNLAGGRTLASEASIVTLTGDEPTSNNSLEQPQAIVPQPKQLRISNPRFSHEFPPHSLTILRVGTK